MFFFINTFVMGCPVSMKFLARLYKAWKELMFQPRYASKLDVSV